MRVQKKSQKKAIVITIISLVAVLAVGAGAYALFSPFDNSASDKSPEKSTSASKKDTSINSDDSAKKPGSTDKNPTAPEREAEKNIQPSYEGNSTNSSESLTGVINYSGVADGKLIIRTTINQAISSGSCRLALTSGAKSVSRESGIVPNPSSASCEGFDVPTSELGSGNWSITITITDGSRSGELKGSVTI